MSVSPFLHAPLNFRLAISSNVSILFSENLFLFNAILPAILSNGDEEDAIFGKVTVAFTVTLVRLHSIYCKIIVLRLSLLPQR